MQAWPRSTWSTGHGPSFSTVSRISSGKRWHNGSVVSCTLKCYAKSKDMLTCSPSVQHSQSDTVISEVQHGMVKLSSATSLPIAQWLAKPAISVFRHIGESLVNHTRAPRQGSRLLVHADKLTPTSLLQVSTSNRGCCVTRPEDRAWLAAVRICHGSLYHLCIRYCRVRLRARKYLKFYSTMA